MTRVAVIDCGSNSTRLLVVDHDGSVLARELRVTRLGEGVDRTRQLSAVAMQRTLDAISEYVDVTCRHDVDRLDVIATSAVRDAQNRSDFLDAAGEIAGTPVRLLTGEEEARASYQGATAGLDAPPYLVVDIGGGSTELALGRIDADGRLLIDAISLDLGCVRITEQFLRGDPYAPEELANAFGAVKELMAEVSAALPIAALQPAMIGVAGTVTSLAAMDLGLTSYQSEVIHHHVLRRDDVEELFRSLATQTNAARQADPTVPAQRADVIVGGAVILLGLMRYFQINQCLVSESDILDGLAFSVSPG